VVFEKSLLKTVLGFVLTTSQVISGCIESFLDLDLTGVDLLLVLQTFLVGGSVLQEKAGGSWKVDGGKVEVGVRSQKQINTA
jgi:hypothetical protein